MIKDKYTQRLNLRLTEYDYKNLDDYCKKYGLTYSKFIQMLLSNFFINKKSLGDEKNENK